MTDKQKEEIINSILSRNPFLSKEEMTNETRLFFDLGLDDFDIGIIFADLEEQFNINIPNDAWYIVNTVGELFNLIEEKLK